MESSNLCMTCGHEFESLDPESTVCYACMVKTSALELNNKEQMIKPEHNVTLNMVRQNVHTHRGIMRGQPPDYILMNHQTHYIFQKEMHRELVYPAGFDYDQTNHTYRFQGIPILQHHLINPNTVLCVYIPKINNHAF